MIGTHRKTRQTRASGERKGANFGDAIGDHVQPHFPFGKSDNPSLSFIEKNPVLAAVGWVRGTHRNTHQARAAIECAIADGCDAVGDGHARQTGAAMERTVTDGCDAVGDGDARQTGAAMERAIADGGDIGDNVHSHFPCGKSDERGPSFIEKNPVYAAVGWVRGTHRNTHQARAAIERAIADFGDAIGDNVYPRFPCGKSDDGGLSFIEKNSGFAAVV